VRRDLRLVAGVREAVEQRGRLELLAEPVEECVDCEGQQRQPREYRDLGVRPAASELGPALELSTPSAKFTTTAIAKQSSITPRTNESRYRYQGYSNTKNETSRPNRGS